MGSIISGKNKQVLKGDQSHAPPCECEQDQCPVDGRCKVTGVIYKATVNTQDQEKFSYVGL